MFHYRVTKYNPQYRDDRGAYLKDEWYLYSQLGDTFEGKVLTYEQYIEKENAYVNAIIFFMTCMDERTLCIDMPEANRNRCCNTVDLLDQTVDVALFKHGLELNQQSISTLARLMLRDLVWCRLESSKMYVHFGWDYYMYIGVDKPCKRAIKQSERTGLFVESFISPYLKSDDDE
jgi:hypothetical protein